MMRPVESLEDTLIYRSLLVSRAWLFLKMEFSIYVFGKDHWITQQIKSEIIKKNIEIKSLIKEFNQMESEV